MKLRGCWALVVAMCAQSVWAGLEEQRQLYRAADKAAGKYQWEKVRELRPQLDEYPLALYLDYAYLESRLRYVDGERAAGFVQEAEGSPLRLRFKGRYLKRAGRDRRWDDYLAVSEGVPRSEDLKCYYYRARRMAGDLEEAWEGAQQMWLYGRSRHKACDPLFEKWIETGQLTDELVWQRMLLAFDAYHGSLMGYVGRQGSAALQPQVEVLKEVYHYPSRLSRTSKLPADEAWSSEVLAHAFPRLAQRDLPHAMRLWDKLETRYPLTEEQRFKIQDALAKRILLKKVSKYQDWLDDYLYTRGDDELLQRRLRWAIRDGEWDHIGPLVASMSVDERRKPAWRFWYARSLQEAGQGALAEEELLALAMDRSFYGFAAAQLLGRPYDLNNRPFTVVEPSRNLDELPGLQRTGELLYHDKPMLAQSEWAYMLGRLERQDQEYLAWLAGQEGWHRFAIDAINEARAWDRLALRFPMAYQEPFQQVAQLHNVPDTELMSIARRESAFFPQAASPVGARGLMQLMPYTAKYVARRLGDPGLTRDLYDVESNIALGSAYYRQLKDSYQGNRVFSLAAYNAGPHRVRAWRSKKGKEVSVMQWVESIPYRETRGYVQNVLAYNLVYQSLRGEEANLFSEAELHDRY